MHLILSGTTGPVGYNVLLCCLASPKVTQISILSRKDFALPQGQQLNSAKAEIWAQGISQTKVSKEYVLS